MIWRLLARLLLWIRANYFGLVCWWYRRQILAGVGWYVRALRSTGASRQERRRALRDLFTGRGYGLWQFFE